MIPLHPATPDNELSQQVDQTQGVTPGHPVPIREAEQANRDVGQESHVLLHRQQVAAAYTGS